MASKYMNSADRAEDNRSSGWTLVIVGGVGLLIILLSAVGIINFPMTGFGKILTMIVMGVLCALFVIMGIVSFKKSKTYATQAQAEGDRESEVIQWFKENFPAERIDELLAEQNEGLPEEELYFNRFGAIRQILFKNFADAGVEFIDHIADEVYEALYED